MVFRVLQYIQQNLQHKQIINKVKGLPTIKYLTHYI